MQYWDEDLKKFVNVSQSNPLPTVQAPKTQHTTTTGGAKG